MPCLVCGKPVLEGQWWLVAAKAHETIQQNSAYDGRGGIPIEQRPVHLTCVSPFPLRRPEG